MNSQGPRLAGRGNGDQGTGEGEGKHTIGKGDNIIRQGRLGGEPEQSRVTARRTTF